MKRGDRDLGMGRDITRRDFIHDVTLASLGLALPLGAWAGERYYPPTRTGLRGSHPGSFEIAHALAREGARFGRPADLGESYDLVVVGGGISGLASAHFWRQRHPDARVLVLDNHDDFGGHAKRNEFHQGGPMRLAWGGTMNMEYPKYSEVAIGLIEDLGIDIPRLLKDFEFGWNKGPDGLRIATWFDAESYGRDVLVPGVMFEGGNPGAMAARADRFPIPGKAREALRSFLLFEGDVLEGMPAEERLRWMRTTSWRDFLKEHFELPDEAIGVFSGVTMGYWGVRAENLSVAECLETGLPGAHALGGYEPRGDDPEGPGAGSAMFPDGNASIARLLVRSLVPEAFPGMPASADPHGIVTAELDYARLDRAEQLARIRLESTVIEARNEDGGVAVTYVRGGEVKRIRAGRCVLACYNRIIPHLCPDLPEAQRAALGQCIKRPMMIINVLLRDGRAIERSGVMGAYLPGRLCQNMRLVWGINAGEYRPQWRAEDPAVVQFYAAVGAPEPDGLSISEQNRAGRQRLLAMSFEDFEREVRIVLNGVFGGGGFDSAEDILAVTVNRWPHGYARDHLDLEDPAWNADPPPNVIGRRPVGNIAIANSDAGADAYTHTAIDQAWRAVNELAS